MIYGVGTDIVRIDRIEALLARWGDRFARRVLGPDEMVEFERRRAAAARGAAYATRYLAKRFAAKEAFAKALGTGIRGPMTLLSLQVVNDPLGRPQAAPRNALVPYLQSQGVAAAHVSLTDEVDSAVAFVILERKEEDEL